MTILIILSVFAGIIVALFVECHGSSERVDQRHEH